MGAALADCGPIRTRRVRMALALEAGDGSVTGLGLGRHEGTEGEGAAARTTGRRGSCHAEGETEPIGANATGGAAPASAELSASVGASTLGHRGLSR